MNILFLTILVVLIAISSFTLGNAVAMHSVDKYLEEVSSKIYNLAKKNKELEKQITEYLSRH